MWWEKIAFRYINARLAAGDIPALRNLELSEGSEEIRLWVGFDNSPIRGLILRKDNGESTALYIQPLTAPKAGSESTVQLQMPKNGWDNLWTKLDQLHFRELPDATEIGLEHNKYLDMRTVVVEVNSQGRYRTYHLFALEVPAEQKYPAVRNIREICALLSDEFGVDLLHYFG
jgi:hypothetical protein